ncbi:MAG: shikimate dehydrogenase [Pseudomonadales bacterium]
MADQYAVFGNPIHHSKSPQIHSAFAQQTAQDIEYTALLIGLDEFVSRAEAFFASGGKGFNITVPFKEQAYQFAQQLSPQAQLAGAVNTLLIDNGVICGHNTDGLGLVSDLIDNCRVNITGAKVLVLGAGGAVRGCLQPLLDQRPAQITIANRTLSKAQQLASIFKSDITVRGVGYSDVDDSYDLIINGTSASLNSELPPLKHSVLAEGAFCYDMMYGAQDTKFISWARHNGCERSSDGLGMLVCQAAEAFRLWRGVAPATNEVIHRLRKAL